MELLAAYWTIAGDVYPGAATEVSPFRLGDRAAAAARAGYTGMGFVHEDLVVQRARLGYPGIRRILGDHGIRYVEVEFLSDWFRSPPDPRRRASDRVRADLLEAAAELGARNLKVSPELFATDPPDIPRLRDGFAELCAAAGDAGTTILIEMMPFTNVNTIERAVAIVEGAGQANGGLLLDIWHVARPGIDLAAIAAIPPGVVRGVELDDADAELVGDPFDDTRFRRRLPGEGSFDVPAFLRSVQAAGFDAPYYGVEIISETFRQQPLDVMARTSFEATIGQVRRAFGADPLEAAR